MRKSTRGSAFGVARRAVGMDQNGHGETHAVRKSKRGSRKVADIFCNLHISRPGHHNIGRDGEQQRDGWTLDVTVVDRATVGRGT